VPTTDTDRILDSIAELRRDLHSVVQSLGKVQGSHEDLKQYVNGRGEQRLHSLEERLRLSEQMGAGQKVMIGAICSVASVVMTFLMTWLMKAMGAR